MLGYWSALLLLPLGSFSLPAALTFGFSATDIRITIPEIHATWPLALLLPGVIAGTAKWVFFTPLHLRPFVGYRLRWYQTTLGAILVLFSLTYLALSLAALPSRREADAKMEALIRNGEIIEMQDRNVRR